MPYADPDQRRRYQREWKRKHPATVVRKLGNVCHHCNHEIDWLFDFVIWKHLTYRISDVLTKTVVIAAAELAQCQLLCCDCYMNTPRHISIPAPISK